jgi:hypothetical protein
VIAVTGKLRPRHFAGVCCRVGPARLLRSESDLRWHWLPQVMKAWRAGRREERLCAADRPIALAWIYRLGQVHWLRPNFDQVVA